MFSAGRRSMVGKVKRRRGRPAATVADPEGVMVQVSAILPGILVEAVDRLVERGTLLLRGACLMEHEVLDISVERWPYY